MEQVLNKLFQELEDGCQRKWRHNVYKKEKEFVAMDVLTYNRDREISDRLDIIGTRDKGMLGIFLVI